MKPFLVVVMVAVMAAIWSAQRISTTQLQTQVDAARKQQHELAVLQREHERLRRLQPAINELDRLRRDGDEHARLRRELIPNGTLKHDRPLQTLAIGEWISSTTWTNRGQATPQSTVETALWAAAGGDVARLAKILKLDDTTRAKAEAVLAGLPSRLRGDYPNAETLIAAFTAKDIPIGEAQLVWCRADAEKAVVCLLLKNPTEQLGTADLSSLHASESERREMQPPKLSPNDKSGAVYLSLQRSSTNDWQLVTPISAVDKIAKELVTNVVR